MIVCDLLGPIPSDEHPYSAEILTQMIFANAAFQIEHSDKVSDPVAVQTAGVKRPSELMRRFSELNRKCASRFWTGCFESWMPASFPITSDP